MDDLTTYGTTTALVPFTKGDLEGLDYAVSEVINNASQLKYRSGISVDYELVEGEDGRLVRRDLENGLYSENDPSKILEMWGQEFSLVHKIINIQNRISTSIQEDSEKISALYEELKQDDKDYVPSAQRIGAAVIYALTARHNGQGIFKSLDVATGILAKRSKLDVVTALYDLHMQMNDGYVERIEMLEDMKDVLMQHRDFMNTVVGISKDNYNLAMSKRRIIGEGYERLCQEYGVSPKNIAVVMDKYDGGTVIYDRLSILRQRLLDTVSAGDRFKELSDNGPSTINALESLITESDMGIALFRAIKDKSQLQGIEFTRIATNAAYSDAYDEAHVAAESLQNIDGVADSMERDVIRKREEVMGMINPDNGVSGAIRNSSLGVPKFELVDTSAPYEGGNSDVAGEMDDDTPESAANRGPVDPDDLVDPFATKSLTK